LRPAELQTAEFRQRLKGLKICVAHLAARQVDRDDYAGVVAFALPAEFFH
jgi:hypothetical protein